MRGVVTTAVAWSLMFVLAQAPVVVALLVLVPRAHRADAWRILFNVSAIWAIAGFVAGGVFAVLLIRLARKRSVLRLSLGRFAAWGAFAGVLAPAVSGPVLVLMGSPANASMLLALGGVGAVVGTLTAGATLWVARRAPEIETVMSGEQPALLS